MKISKFTQFIKESTELELHYYAFDWDDNILHMSTLIHMDKKEGDSWVPVDVSTADFAKVRNDKENYRMRNNNPDEAYSEFRDFGPRGPKAFLEDTKSALSKNDLGPAWKSFIQCLSEGALFAIITARGHEPDSIRESVEYIIDNNLSDDEKFLLYSNCLKHAYIFKGDKEVDFDRIPKGQLSKTPLVKTYLDSCYYWGVSSNTFRKEFLEKYWAEGNASNPEKAKEMALDFFIKKCHELGDKVNAKSVSLGFSDDDPGNVEHVRKFFKAKSALSGMKLNLYDTNKRGEVPKRTRYHAGEETKFHENSGSSIAPGMASSVMPFTQFNNMADRMFTNNQEQDKSMRLGSTQLAKMSKNIKKKREGK